MSIQGFTTADLMRAAKQAGAKDVLRVASCISHGARLNGIAETIAIWQEKAPELFYGRALVVDPRTEEVRGEKRRDPFRGRASKARDRHTQTETDN